MSRLRAAHRAQRGRALTQERPEITLRCLGRRKNNAAAIGSRLRLPGAGHRSGAPLPRRAVRGRSTRRPPVPGGTQPGQ